MMKKISAILTLALAMLACSSAVDTVTPPARTATPQPTATEIIPMPTPFSAGDQVRWRDLQVTMDQVEVTENFVNEYGSTRMPPAGKKFMWVQIEVRNVGQGGVNLPLPENFSALYAEEEFKPVYGHRNGYVEFATLNPTIFPNENLNGWLRFDIPVTAELKDVLFVFLPESSQVGVSSSSPNYPYANDKPTYVWKFE